LVVQSVTVREAAAQVHVSKVEEVRALVGSGQLDSALSVVRRALTIDSLNVDLLKTLGDIQRIKGQSKARRATLDKIIGLQPRAIDARLEIAEELFESGKLDSAAHFAGTALAQSNRRSADAFYWLGRIHGEAGRPDSALIYYRWAWILLPSGELY
jgi:tetratricopeptide (TPR) repeat protein